MYVLGISGGERDAAVAIAADGNVVAAATEECVSRCDAAGDGQTDGFPASALKACLSAAGVNASEIDQVTVVHEGGTAVPLARTGVALRHARIRPMDPVTADAMVAAASVPHAPVFVWTNAPARIATFRRHNGSLGEADTRAGGDDALAGARQVADALGLQGRDPYGAIDRLSLGADVTNDRRFADAISWKPEVGIVTDPARVTRLIDEASAKFGGAFADPACLNVRVQEARRSLAADFICRLAQVAREGADELRTQARTESVVFGGAMFANQRFATELRTLLGGWLPVAAVPESCGRALGAALTEPLGVGDRRLKLAVGPGFSEHDIKKVLDGCRLDYVYEPDWEKLFLRVSRMLESGKVVAWAQGPMGFGARAAGTRSVLCDPSSRYARENMNEFLRQAPLDEPLPLVFARSVADRCVGSPIPPDVRVMETPIEPAWRDRVATAIDWRGNARVHMLEPEASALAGLLEAHFLRTGVPALIETTLSGAGEPVACSPREVVRATYSSSIDAAIIGRFVLMKDYWLLRSHAD